MVNGVFGAKKQLRYGWIISRYRQRKGQKHTSIKGIRKQTRLSYRDSRTHHILISSDISARSPIWICLSQTKRSGGHLNQKTIIQWRIIGVILCGVPLSFLQEFWNTGIGITKEIEIHDYLFQPSNFFSLSFFFLIKNDYLCGVILEHVDLQLTARLQRDV